LDLPGIGTIALQMRSSVSDMAERHFSPPLYFFALKKTDEIPQEKLFSWLASHFKIADSEAVIWFNDFIFDLTRQLKEGKEIHWHKIGILQKEFTGEIKFTSVREKLEWLENVPAKKIIRENAEHRMLVGEVEKTSAEMSKLLQTAVTFKKEHWWVWPLAVIIAVIIFLGLYFSEYGIKGSSTRNHIKTSPANAPSGYKLTP
jgi:hypothetical protein